MNEPRVSGPLRLALAASALAMASCSAPESVEDRTPTSAYPTAVDAAKVGTYPALTKSGGGYFYDQVLEYRVWVHSTTSDDSFHAFRTFEAAERYASRTNGAEPPLVLVLQHEHVNETQPGKYEHVKGDRVTEWRVEWLENSKRTATSIAEFLRERGK